MDHTALRSTGRPSQFESRATVACLACRKSKIRCRHTGNTDQCDRCRNQRRDCIYPRAARPPRSVLQRSHDRLHSEPPRSHERSQSEPISTQEPARPEPAQPSQPSQDPLESSERPLPVSPNILIDNSPITKPTIRSHVAIIPAPYSKLLEMDSYDSQEEITTSLGHAGVACSRFLFLNNRPQDETYLEIRHFFHKLQLDTAYNITSNATLPPREWELQRLTSLIGEDVVVAQRGMHRTLRTFGKVDNDVLSVWLDSNDPYGRPILEVSWTWAELLRESTLTIQADKRPGGRLTPASSEQEDESRDTRYYGAQAEVTSTPHRAIAAFAGEPSSLSGVVARSPIRQRPAYSTGMKMSALLCDVDP